MTNQSVKNMIGGIFFIIALIFVYRSFYGMRIPEEQTAADGNLVLPHDVHGKKEGLEKTMT
jgi:K(+)-stimulated pyrophosphate-energized sodium pump